MPFSAQKINFLRKNFSEDEKNFSENERILNMFIYHVICLLNN